MYDHFRVLRIDSMISKDQKKNIICTIDECGETFFGCHTAQHPAAVIVHNWLNVGDFKKKGQINITT